MPINTELLIAAPMLQDAIIDKTTGLPLYNGKIVLWQDTARTILKNWYYQTGTPGAYTYLPLPNPLTLGSAGSITDINGVDVIPFYYPYSEIDNTTIQTYFIQVFDQFGQLQFTRSNFPPGVNNTPIGTDVDTNSNLITNSAFWRNIGSVNATTVSTDPANGYIGIPVAPSQHDDFAFPDIQFIKDVSGAEDTISFFNFVNDSNSPTQPAPFNDQIIPDQITPEYYMNLTSTSVGMETKKYLQIPLQAHVSNLSDVLNCTFTIAAMSPSNTSIEIAVFQYLGTGVSSPIPRVLTTLNLTNDWQKYPIHFQMNSSQDMTLGKGGDDGWYMQIIFPVNRILNVNLAYPAFYLSNNVPTNDWETYDEINAVVSSPRTGDIRQSLNGYVFGYVPMNDGTIGITGSIATTRANNDTFRLFNLIWNWANANQSIAPMYNSSGDVVTYGDNPYADFTANNVLSLTRALGRVIMGAVPTPYSTTVNAVVIAGTTLNLVGTTGGFKNNGVPVVVTSTGDVPGPLIAGNPYFLEITGSNTIALSLTPGGSAITYTNAGSGTTSVTLYGGGYAGQFLGEYNHTMTQDELVAHNHAATAGSFIQDSGSSNEIGAGTFIPTVTSPVTASTGGSTPFNVAQPSTFYNLYIKL